MLDQWPGVPVLATWEEEQINSAERGLLESVRQLVQIFGARAGVYDETRTFPLENLVDLHQAGVLRAAIPSELGGADLSLRAAAFVVEEIARACASTAWLMMIHFGFMYMLPTLIGDSAGPIFRKIARHGFTAAGATNIVAMDANEVENGYLLNGRARFCGGVRSAEWISVPVTVFHKSDADQDHSRVFWFTAQRPGVKVLDNWNTMSLRATRSEDLLLEDVFVAHSESFPFTPDTPPAVASVTRRYPGVWQALFLQNALFLGVAQGTLDWVVAFARQRGMRRDHAAGRSDRAIANLPGIQFAIADSIADIASARSLLYHYLDLVEQRALSDTNDSQAASGSQHTLALHMSRTTTQSVNRLFSIVGGEAIFHRHPIERMFRDIQVATLADGNQPDRLREYIGKYYLGIPLDQEPRWA